LLNGEVALHCEVELVLVGYPLNSHRPKRIGHRTGISIIIDLADCPVSLMSGPAFFFDKLD
jgi:hypothetical protein